MKKLSTPTAYVANVNKGVIYAKDSVGVLDECILGMTT